jgi:hypothetical protein
MPLDGCSSAGPTALSTIRQQDAIVTFERVTALAVGRS